MFKTATAALLLAAASAFDNNRSVDSVRKMRGLSASLYANEKDGVRSAEGFPRMGAAGSVIDDINEMMDFFDDIPGAGYIISIIFPGDADTKAIMELLGEIQQELTEMHGEMRQAWNDIMTQANLYRCYEQLEPKEEVIYAAWEDFRIWLEALNAGTHSEAYVDQQKDYFVTNCEGNACMNAARYLLNGLSPRGAFPELECNYLEAMYNSSGVQGYKGYRDYVATKSAMMLLESTVASIMETVNLIETSDLTPEEALESTINRFGPWMKQSAEDVKRKVQACYDNASSTVDGNRATAVTRIFGATTDKQTRVNKLHDTLKSIYNWNNWVAAAANEYDHVCYFDYRCDNKVYCHYQKAYGLQVVVAEVASSTKAPIQSFVNQPRWDYWTTYGEMCTAHVRDQIAEAGCGGGSIVSRTRQDMKYKLDRDELWEVHYGHDQQLIAWADHDCACYWPDCNSAAEEFLE